MMKTKMKMLTHNDLFKRIFHPKFHSVFVGILGPNQSGKTALMLLIAERLYKMGLYKYFGSNIEELKGAPFEYDFIEDYPTLKQRSSLVHSLGERYLFLGDELGDWAPKDQPWLNVKLIKEMQKVRKYQLSFIGCAIDRVDERILNPKNFSGYFEKPNKNNQGFAVYYDWIRNRKAELHDLPNTTITFDTWYSAMFYMERQNYAAPMLLTPEHELVKKWLGNKKSWKALDVHPQEGGRAIEKVLRYHFETCLTSHTKTPEESSAITGSQAASLGSADEKCDSEG